MVAKKKGKTGFNEGSILIKRARENNLKNLTVELPRGKLIGVTGVSGSGKSSLVFDVMAAAGMGNPRLMADGVAKATVPTMAGMVGALSGVFAIYWLEWQSRWRVEDLADHLDIEQTLEQEPAHA